MYGENTKTIAIPMYKILPHLVIPARPRSLPNHKERAPDHTHKGRTVPLPTGCKLGGSAKHLAKAALECLALNLSPGIGMLQLAWEATCPSGEAMVVIFLPFRRQSWNGSTYCQLRGSNHDSSAASLSLMVCMVWPSHPTEKGRIALEGMLAEDSEGPNYATGSTS